jgi:exosortase D (VPLPA-CTERM-specific)
MKAIGIVKSTGLAKIAMYGLLLIGVYYSSLVVMISQWGREDYSYCYLIPFIVLYLIWEKRIKLVNLPSVSSWKGLIPLILGIAFFWLGELGGEYFTLYISFWLVMVGLCWIHLGWQKLKIISFPLAVILTMFPPPNFIYQKISVNLKLASSQLGVAMMQVFGMSAYREGNVIDLGFTQLQVVDACSGLRYLFPLIVLGILLAYFYKAAFWKKAVLVISTVPISIVVNGLRIALVGMLYPIFGPKVAEGFFHDFAGWFIFMVSLGILLAEMWILKKIGHRPTQTDTDRTNEKKGLQNMNAQSREAESSKLKVQSTEGLMSFLRSPQFVVAVIK